MDGSTDGPTGQRTDGQIKPLIELRVQNKQGRIHSYPSRIRVGKDSDEIDQLGNWAGAVTPQTTRKRQKSKVFSTDQPTD